MNQEYQVHEARYHACPDASKAYVGNSCNERSVIMSQSRYNHKETCQMIETETGLPDPERFLASAAKFLIEGGENDMALLLTACRLTLSWDDSSYGTQITAHLTGPRMMYDAW